MYPYHNMIKNRIKNNEMIGHKYVEDYPGIGAALILYFSTAPHQKPIRPHKWHEYEKYLKGE